MPHSGPGTRYREIRQLGAGGMGTVILAEDSVLGRPVALKRVPGRGDPRSALRLKREALVGASLNHPNLVSVYDALIQDDGDVVIVMEYVEGQTLAERIRASGPLPPAEALRVLHGVAAALDAIHAQGIVHRDVKPANVLLGEDGVVKLADLGIADVADRTRITSADAVVGSFSYMSPEQLNGAVPGPAMDIYALSAVAYEMLSGRKARPESNPLALAHAISTKPAPDLRQVLPSVPRAAADVLQRGMSADPAQRPKHAADLVRRLETAFEPERPAPTVPIAMATAPTARRQGTRVRERPAASAARAAAGASARPAAGARARPPARRRPTRLAPLLAAVALLAFAGVIGAVLLSVGGNGRAGRRTSAADRRRVGAAAGPTSRTSTSSSRTSAAGSSTPTSDATSTPSQSTSTPSQSASTPAARTGEAGAHGPPASSRPDGHGHSGPHGGAVKPHPHGGPPAGHGGPPGGPAGPSARRGAASDAATTPVATVRRFYTAAAAHRYALAWSLADPNMQNQLGGYAAFQREMSPVRSITFHRTRVVGGTGSGTTTVALQTTSVQRSGPQRCSGTARTVRDGGSWRLDGISISCS
ncbi:MAG TPA: serine/threonine-protein kinase [Solirubrobacteraceae bacterium]|nr:serine/threonine-protein kinase [Solirubrobacteraceae bacterium]